MLDKIFVYGSLRSDMFNYDRLLKGKTSKIEKGYMKGHLSHIENKGYPAGIDGEDKITGEIMELIDFEKSLIELDKLENYTIDNEIECEYIRKIKTIEKEDGSTVQAYVYMYNPESSMNKEDKLTYINHGDWKVHMTDTKK